MFLSEQVLNSYLKQAGGGGGGGGGGQACRRSAIVSTYVPLCYLFLDRRSSDSTLVVFENKGIFIAIDHWPLRFSLGFLHSQFDFSQTHNDNGTQLSDIDYKCKFYVDLSLH